MEKFESIIERRVRLQNERRAELQAEQAGTHAAGRDCALYDCPDCTPKRIAAYRGKRPEFLTHIHHRDREIAAGRHPHPSESIKNG